jgi:ketosteroid isomerase-like protein
MKIIHIILISFFLFFILSCSKEKVNLETERQQVVEVLDNFISAHENKDIDRLMSCFSDKPDILILGTDKNELWVDTATMGDSQKRAYDTFEKIKLSVRDKVLKMSKSGKTAWFYMKVDWYVESAGEKFKYNDIRTTGVLENDSGRWSIVQLHTSLPVEGQAVSY